MQLKTQKTPVMELFQDGAALSVSKAAQTHTPIPSLHPLVSRPMQPLLCSSKLS